jgi:hypothetical protein
MEVFEMPDAPSIPRPEDAFKPGSKLQRSVVRQIEIAAPFRRWGSSLKIDPPWGRAEYWNIIVSQESIGGDEPENWQDNVFIHQQIRVEQSNDGWNIYGRSFYSFWNPPQPQSEPGLSISARVLLVLK